MVRPKPKSRLDHKFTAKNLSAYLDGRLTNREIKRVENHLAECAACQEDMVTLRETRVLLHQASIRPVPRSFTLPVAAQAEQTRFRRWNTAYGVLRSASAVISLVLVLFLSGDALLGRGLLGLSGQQALSGEKEQVAEMSKVVQETVVVREVEKVVSEPTEETVEPQVFGLGSGPTPTGSAPAAAESADEGLVMETAATPDVAATSPEAVGSPRHMVAGQKGLTEAPTIAKSVEAESVEKAAGGGGDEGAGVENASTDTAESPTTLPEPMPSPTPTMARVAVAIQPTEEARVQISPDDSARTLSPLWSVWQLTRILSGVFVGMLLILVAGLIWVGQKRKA